MDSAELAEWIAVHTHFMPLPDPWHQTGVLAAATLAPYSKKGKPPKASDFVPITPAPQSPEQMNAVLRDLAMSLKRE